MEGGDALGLIAEVSIAVAGFAGVIATLRAPGGRIGAYAAMRLGNLLAYIGLLALTAHSLFLFAYILFAPSRAEVQA